MKCLTTLAMILGCAEAFAQGVNSNTKIQMIGNGIGARIPGQDNTYNISYVFVVLPTNNSTPASCVDSGHLNYFAVDSTTNDGRALIVAIRKRWMLGGAFTFIGANTCNIYPGVEDLAMAAQEVCAEHTLGDAVYICR
jgi:hypothetical protein